MIVSRAVESDDPNVQALVFEMMEFLYHWGDHKGCLDFAEDAYANRLRLLGEEHQQTLRMAKYVGYMRFILGKYADAAALF